jgi:outer membrane protein OmpA-like peptidoglycan-associated protein
MFNLSDFNHIAISFNKRALKFYINGTRMVNIPRCDAPTRFQLFSYQGEAQDERFIKNIRMAKGAVPLYDRMMSDGKIITYGITFDVNKSTIKPESMGEINRIATLMKENPDLKFSVEGHTDGSGNAAANQTLSDARSKAVVDKLVSLGIEADRLQAAGKGQTSPIADNGTDEGRAKNRRVEFVKL